MLKLSLKSKLFGLVIFLIILQAITNLFGGRSLEQVSGNYEKISQVNLRVFQHATAMASAVYSIRGDLNRIVYKFDDADTKKQIFNQISEHIVNYEKALEEYKKLPQQEGEKEVFEPIELVWNRINDFVNQSIDIATKSESAADAETYKMRVEKFTILLNAYRIANDAWLDFQLASANQQTELSRQVSQQSTVFAMAMLVVSSLFGLGLGYIIINKLAASLTRISDSVNNASVQVSSASDELSHSSEQLSSSSQQQASALEETSASLTEISGMAESNVNGAVEVNTSAKEVYDITTKTKKSMEELAGAMSEILSSNERIETLVKIIEEIGEKTQVIDDIVFKTQLLSFNASVEAERAGEHGRGFAVVAQEVGNLAQLSGKAALEISSIVKNSIKEAASVASENKTRVSKGEGLAKETSEHMNEVLEKMTGILESISKIVDASKEQGQGITQIGTSVESVSQLTQETASTAQQTASASTELSVQASALMGLVGELKQVITGKAEQASSVKNSNVDNSKKSENLAPVKKPEKKKASKLVTDEKVEHKTAPVTKGDDSWEKL